VDAVITAIQMGVQVARVELVDTASAQAVNAYAGASFPACPHLLLEFHGSDTAVAEDAATFGAERALALGGTITGEHGVGMGKLDFMQSEHGDAWGVMGACVPLHPQWPRQRRGQSRQRSWSIPHLSPLNTPLTPAKTATIPHPTRSC